MYQPVPNSLPDQIECTLQAQEASTQQKSHHDFFGTKHSGPSYYDIYFVSSYCRRSIVGSSWGGGQYVHIKHAGVLFVVSSEGVVVVDAFFITRDALRKRKFVLLMSVHISFLETADQSLRMKNGKVPKG